MAISVLAVTSMFTAPAVSAAVRNDAPKADRKAQQEAAVLRKYDKNGNGVLDADEQAARQANVDKMKALRDAKKRKAEERKAASAAPQDHRSE